MKKHRNFIKFIYNERKDKKGENQMRKRELVKKAALLSCALTLSVGITGCGSKNKNDADNGTAGTAHVTATEPSSEEEQPAASAPDTISETDDKAMNAKVDQLAEPKKGETVATFHVKDFGDIKVHFFQEAAPKAVENFVTHAKDGYYNGVTFHRVVNDFMIQGGDPLGNGTGGESIWKQEFHDEINKYLLPLKGSLCMANAGGGCTNGSQFFIVQSGAIESEDTEQLKNYINQNVIPQYKSSTGLTLEAYDDSAIENYKKTGGCLFLSGGYTVFGQVYEGQEVVDAIAATQKEGTEQPENEVLIESIEVSEY